MYARRIERETESMSILGLSFKKPQNVKRQKKRDADRARKQEH